MRNTGWGLPQDYVLETAKYQGHNKGTDQQVVLFIVAEPANEVRDYRLREDGIEPSFVSS